MEDYITKDERIMIEKAKERAKKEVILIILIAIVSITEFIIYVIFFPEKVLTDLIEYPLGIIPLSIGLIVLLAYLFWIKERK